MSNMRIYIAIVNFYTHAENISENIYAGLDRFDGISAICLHMLEHDKDDDCFEIYYQMEVWEDGKRVSSDRV